MNENETIITNPADNNTPDTGNSQQYIDAIREMQKNSVSKEKYAKLEAENKQLLDTLVNGGTIEQVVVEPEVTTNDLRKKIAGSDKTKINNLDYMTTLLELRNRRLEEDGDDIFAQNNSYEERTKAERVAAIYQHCVDISNGDPDAFDREFQSRLVEDPAYSAKNNNNKRRF